MKQTLLIKYSEIGVKGKNRYVFEDMLVKNMKSALKALDGEYEVRKASGRMYVNCEEKDLDEAIEALKKVFGIAWICPVSQYDRLSMDELKEAVLKHMQETYPSLEETTFKVNCRRVDKAFPLTSMEVNEEIGGVLLDAYPQLKVDVHKPELMLNIELRPYDVNIYSKQIEGLCGMPVGSGGKAMLLLSGGIDSPVAGYLMAKRGVSLDAVYFHAPPYTSERAKQKVVDLAKIVSRYAGPIKLHVVNFTEIQMKIYEICPHDELTIIMRRFMMRIAEHFAKQEDCLGLVTGESIGQVASQTMQSMVVTNEVCTLPVYRPLCCFDKMDIVEISEKIDAYETSILPYEDCCTIFVAKHPVTKPRLDRIQKSEKRLDGIIEELYQKALETTEVIEI
ncbi:MAG: tRNA uracil 4-sulfurtransferase ThiI [Lachnospiraceae bacterium]|nr:tRNA uracil 4-sulfurtransferase ThiI [Lachnospiraceae bacterium]